MVMSPLWRERTPFPNRLSACARPSAAAAKTHASRSAHLTTARDGRFRTVSSRNVGRIANPSVGGGITRGRIGNPSYSLRVPQHLGRDRVCWPAVDGAPMHLSERQTTTVEPTDWIPWAV